MPLEKDELPGSQLSQIDEDRHQDRRRGEFRHRGGQHRQHRDRTVAQRAFRDSGEHAKHQRDDHGQAEHAAGEDGGVGEMLAEQLRHRRVEHDRGAEVAMDEAPDPRDVAPPQRLVIAVLLEPEVALRQCRIGPKHLGRDIVLVALEQQEQDQRDRQHDEDHGRQTSKGDPKHGFPGSSFASLNGVELVLVVQS